MLKAQILLSALIFSCAPNLLWRRRDNVLGYLQFGFFVAAFLVPVLGTTVVDDASPKHAEQYANLMLIGAGAFLVGLAAGGRVGGNIRLPRLSFGTATPMPSVRVALNARRIAVGGVVVFMGSFALLGYVPLLTADRQLAKYGVGPYAAGFARGSLFYNVSLTVGSTILPVLLAFAMRQRRLLDVVLAFTLFSCLMMSLSRQMAFIGPLVFLIALAVERRWRAWAITASVAFAYVGSALFNTLVSLAPLSGRKSFPEQVLDQTADVRDYIAFLDGFEQRGSVQLGMRPLTAALKFSKEAFNPADYALKVRTGLNDITGLASGGIRLPAPVWGFASFGYAGGAVWSLISGFFIALGVVVVRRALTPSFSRGTQVVQIVLAWVFYEGTFGVLAEFYFFPRVAVIACVMAVMVGFAGHPRPTRPPLIAPRPAAGQRMSSKSVSRSPG